MNSKNQIIVNDFNLFTNAIQATSKIVDAAKISINENGFAIYGCRGKFTRCEMTSNSICSETPIDVVVDDMSMLVRILSTVNEIQAGDFTDFKMTYAKPQLKFESKKFKTKLQTQTEEVIAQWVSKKIETELKPEFEFSTTSDLIKRVNSHSYIFKDQKELRIYLETKDDMEKNAIFATLGNKANDLNNEMTLKFGLVTFGKLSDDRKLILDLEHLNLFNAINSNDIKIFLPSQFNMLVSKVKVNGKNDTYFNINIYNGLLKN